MDGTTTVAIVAVAAVGLFLFYENQQSQQAQQYATQQVLLAKVTAPPASANPLSSLTSLIGPVLSAL
jgi:hypothetical protein